MAGSTHHPVWLQDEPALRYPRLDRDLDVDVAVIGAGITGLTAALLLRREGCSVAVLDRHAVARGATGHSSGHLTAVLDTPYRTLVSRFGEDGTRAVVAASMDAIDAIGRLAVELAADVRFQRVPGYRWTERADERDELAHEAELAARLGLRAAPATDVPLPFPVAAAYRVEDQAVFHPLRYAAALARALVAEGGTLCQDSPVLDVEDGEPCVVTLAEHRVRARHVVQATHAPMNRVIPVQARLGPYTSYVLCAQLARPAPAALCWDTAEPYHYLRPLLPGSDRLVAGGADHKTGQAGDATQCALALEAWVRERFDVLAVEQRWSAQVFEPADGLPFIGTLGGDHVHLATGFAGTGLTLGTVAAQMLRDRIVGREHPLATLLRATRVKPLASAPDVVRENANVAWRLVRDRLARPEAETTAVIAPGEGRIMSVEQHRAAVYRDAEGALHVMSPVCTHLGCIVHWNASGATWDCPCHGGRYTPLGEPLDGPPTRGLERGD